MECVSVTLHVAHPGRRWRDAWGAAVTVADAGSGLALGLELAVALGKGWHNSA
jgi:hypothetical protein